MSTYACIIIWLCICGLPKTLALYKIHAQSMIIMSHKIITQNACACIGKWISPYMLGLAGKPQNLYCILFWAACMSLSILSCRCCIYIHDNNYVIIIATPTQPRVSGCGLRMRHCKYLQLMQLLLFLLASRNQGSNLTRNRTLNLRV